MARLWTLLLGCACVLFSGAAGDSNQPGDNVGVLSPSAIRVTPAERPAGASSRLSETLLPNTTEGFFAVANVDFVERTLQSDANRAPHGRPGNEAVHEGFSTADRGAVVEHP